MARSVTYIPATVNPMTRMPAAAIRRRRVAGYARVSTDKDEQFTSYEAQVDYYTRFIKARNDWEFVNVYTDEGISGLGTKKRDGFNEMIRDALAGKIDLIVTKSVSRFARNTVDSLVTIRKLKEAGCECYFEKENIYTFDGKGELLLTIMSSLAQEESRSISENVTWGQRKRFADGKINLPYKRFLGYEKGPDGFPQIVPEEAEVIRCIYSKFMMGKTPGAIARYLTEEEIPTPGGKRVWQPSTVESIVKNEKYKGSAILQKTFTVDFLTKKVKTNEGEVPQYYVDQSHEAIITPTEWDAVQAEIKRRKAIGYHFSGASIFSTRVYCGDCGGFYGAKLWHSNSKYQRVNLLCNRKYKGITQCETPHIREDDLRARFLAAWNRLIENRDEQIENCRIILAALTDTSALEASIAETQSQIGKIAELTQLLVDENARTTVDQEEFNRKYAELLKRYERLASRLEELEDQREDRRHKAEAISGFMFELKEKEEPITAFDDKLFILVIDRITVYRDGRLVFRFKNGTEAEG